jgi:cytochrome P450
VSLVGPEPLSTNPLRRVLSDIQDERSNRLRYPAGDLRPSVRRTHAMVQHPLPLLLRAYARYGPVFSLRILHAPSVFMIGPEANHHVLVSHADNFRWRDGGLGDLIPLLGDGLLTIDGDFHRQSRRIMLPAFHREQIAASLETIQRETELALAGWYEGARVDIYRWARELALRVAMRALFGFDPDERRGRVDPAREFETALSFYGREYWMQVLRGPRTPWAAMQRARARLDRVLFAEIERRRASGDRGADVLSLLLDARDAEDGSQLSDAQVRDEVMTLLFAGHDTTTATISFLFRELALAPEWADTIAREVRGPAPGAAELMGGAYPALDMVLDETLRMYPPAWIGPRRCNETFDFAGTTIPAGSSVNYSSWATHHLPDVWEDAERFDPRRFSPERRAQIPKGAYVPFGGGSRTCIGMRFGQLEIKAISARILREFRLDLRPHHRLVIRQTPTLGPHGGLTMVVRSP